MGKKLTHEEFIARVIEKNEHVRNGEIEILGTYEGKDKSIKCHCISHDVIWEPKPGTLYKGSGCPTCKGEKISKSKFMSRDQFVNLLKEAGNKTVLYGDYNGIYEDAEFLCPVGHIFTDKAATVLHGNVKCPYCAGRRVLVGFNDLWTTAPAAAAMLSNPNDGYNITKGTNIKQSFTCPLCGKVQDKYVINVVRRGLQCSNCSDHITFPNRFGRAFLSQLPIDNFIPEYHPDWLKPYRYDNYFQYNNKEYVLEMDGGIGHGNKQWKTGDKDVDGKMIDELKDKMAIARNVHVIRIDYQESSCEYIKKNILESDLSCIFNLSEINWEKCNMDAQKNLVKECCDLYMFSTKNLHTIADELKISHQTVWAYLKRGVQFGWCDYDPKQSSSAPEIGKYGRKIIITNIDSREQFTFGNIGCCEREIFDTCGIKISHNTIRKYCNNKQPYNGYIFNFMDETIQN